MNKKSVWIKKGLSVFACFILAFIIRLFFMAFSGAEATDEFHYFQASMIQEENQEPVMTSGIAYAYTQCLSNILRFTGNRIQVVAVFHFILQMLSFWFLFWGFRFFFGKQAAFFASVMFALWPWLITGILQVSPENFYLFWWSFIFFMIAIFFKISREKGWYRYSWDEAYLLITGFLLGVNCIWHYMGVSLCLLFAYAVIKNSAFLLEKRKNWKNACIMKELLEEEEIKEKSDEIMPVYAQILIVIAGMLIGSFCTLMKYTGVTGCTLAEQFTWWYKQVFSAGNGRFQDLEVLFICWILLIALTGAAVQQVFDGIILKKQENNLQKMEQENNLQKIEQENIMAEEQRQQKDTKEQKKVEYIENPLPLPKKHVKRTLDFKLDQKDDFDIDIEKNDDFDI